MIKTGGDTYGEKSEKLFNDELRLKAGK